MRMLSQCFLGLCLVAGLYLAGQQIGRGGTHWKNDVRTVTVKGLVEKEVKADQAVWKLSFRRASGNLGEAQTQIKTDKEAVLVFLQQQGFKPEEISQLPTRTVDKMANEYGNNNQNEDKLRYVLVGQVLVTTTQVDRVKDALEKTDQLQAGGVVLDISQDNGANPRFNLSKFNELRPQLLAQATQNGRETAEQFAASAGVKVGKLRSANQGVIQIFGADGQDESGGYSATSSIQKKVRVVSSFEFDLK